ncbi:hypothetical protein ACTXT7_005591 [Hymenolepis weldensis]
MKERRVSGASATIIPGALSIHRHYLGGLTFMALIRFRASAGQGAFGGGFPPSAMDGGMGTSAGIDDMYPSQPRTSVGPMPPQQQQPVGGGGGVGAVNSSSYYPPPTF